MSTNTSGWAGRDMTPVRAPVNAMSRQDGPKPITKSAAAMARPVGSRSHCESLARHTEDVTRQPADTGPVLPSD